MLKLFFCFDHKNSAEEMVTWSKQKHNTNTEKIMVRHCAYGRVSSLEQSENTNAANQQRSRLLRSGAQKIFFDIQSGTDDDRPQFNQLLSELKQGFWDRVTITRDDRITRNSRMALELLDLFKELNVELEILDAGGVVDFSNPYSWMQRAQAGINSQYESMMLSHRVKKGYEHLRGEVKANPQIPYGYVRINEKYYISTELRNLILDSIDIFLSTKNLRQTCIEIRKKYGKSWTPSGFSKWIINPVLRGHTPYFYVKKWHYKQIIYNTHLDQAIISEDQFKKIKLILEDNARYRGANLSSPKYPLTGIVYCGECDSKMDVFPSKGIVYYSCKKRRMDKSLCSQKKCIRMDELEKRMVDFLIQKSENIVNLAQKNEKFDSPKIQELNHQLQGLMSLGANPVIDEAIQKLKRQIKQEIDKNVLSGEKFNKQLSVIGGWLESFQDVDLWLTQDMEVRRLLYKNLFSKIIVLEGEVTQLMLYEES